jgi:hypothetical protein
MVPPVLTASRNELAQFRDEVDARLGSIESKIDHLQDHVLALLTLLTGPKSGD